MKRWTIEDIRLSAQRCYTRIVLANGCFDMVHPGHVRHLRWAKDQGDALVVAVTGDRHINKGPGRPWVPERHRAELVEALDMVDYVIINDADDPYEIIRTLKPDVYVKGWEYHDRVMPEMAALEEVGARVLFSPNDVVYSSTALGPPRG